MNKLTFEQVKSDYFDEDALIEPDKHIWRIDGHGYRHYYKINPIQFFISVTSMIDATMPKGYGFNQWLKNGTPEETDYRRDSRAAYGTLFHIQAGQYIVNESYNLDAIESIVSDYANQEGYPELINEWETELSKDILSLANFINEKNVNPLAVEIGLADPTTGLAGCLDLVCELDFNRGRKTAIIDFKSGNFWPSHIVQLEAYKRLWESNYKDKQIDMLFNWSSNNWRSKPSYKLKNQTNQSDRNKLDALLELWKIDHPKNKPNDYTEFSGKIEKGTSLETNYKVTSIESIIKQKHEI